MPHEWTPVVFPEDTDRPEVDVQGRILGPFDSPILHSGETGSHQVEMTNHERRAVTFDIEGTHDDPRLEYGEPLPSTSRVWQTTVHVNGRKRRPRTEPRSAYLEHTGICSAGNGHGVGLKVTVRPLYARENVHVGEATCNFKCS